jgi:hypothetical protein
VVVVLDEDAVPPPASERRDAMVVLALELAQVPAVTSHLPAVEVPAAPPTMEVQAPPRLQRWQGPPRPEFRSQSRR